MAAMGYLVTAMVSAGIGITYRALLNLTQPDDLSALVPAPEAFDTDSDAGYIFLELNEYRHLDNISFIQCQNAVDNILMLVKRFSLLNVCPKIGDLAEAEIQGGIAIEAFEKIMSNTESPQITAALESLSDTLQDLLGRNLTIIAGLCEGSLESRKPRGVLWQRERSDRKFRE
jgi:hypothetical protein